MTRPRVPCRRDGDRRTAAAAGAVLFLPVTVGTVMAVHGVTMLLLVMSVGTAVALWSLLVVPPGIERRRR